MLLRIAPVGIFTTLVIASLFQSFPAVATSIDWEGKYRFELVDIDNPSLLSKDKITHKNKAYWLHYAELRPKVIASDSLRINGRISLLNNSHAQYQNSNLGSFMGEGPRPSTTSATNSDADSNVLSDRQASSSMAVSELYMTWEQEYGSLLVGRAPLHFGLGMQYNSGRGLFDHWADSRDVVGYKIVSGNLFLLPMIANINEGDLGSYADDVKEQIFQFGYTNPDSKMNLGFIWVERTANSKDNDPTTANDRGNDVPANVIGTDPSNNTTGVVLNRWKVKDVNLYASQTGKNYRYAFEFGFRDGQSGVQLNGEDVKIESYGVAAEVDYMPDGNWSYHLKMGYATGDKSDSPNKYEGYVFDRNYDAGFLLFNHPLGDPSLNTGIHRLTQLSSAGTKAEDVVDEDAFTNGQFIIPSLKVKLAELYDLEFSYIMANLNQELVKDAGTALGSEIDVTLIYRPYKNMQWITTLGYLSPGEAFKGGASDFGNSSIYGLTTKAAISF